MPAQGELGVALRAARDRAVLSQKELADRAGVSQAVVSRMERGHRTSWTVFCRLLDAMGFEPVVTTLRRKSDLDREVDRLATMTPAERVAEHDLFLEWLPQSVPFDGWAVDGDAALAAHGVPVVPYRFLIAVVDDPAVQVKLDMMRNDAKAPFDFRTLPALPPVVHVAAGDTHVPLMPLNEIDLGEAGSRERTVRQAALDAYVRSLPSAT
jgi:transcriptional regulator with XRE-family HTH domain